MMKGSKSIVMNRILMPVLFTLVTAAALRGDEIRLTLPEAVARARSHSVDAAAALAELQGAYWEYRSYRADLLPEISFNAKVPSYRRQYSTYMSDAGDYSFVRNNYIDITGELSLSQNIWLTGGKVSLSTSLDFMRQFGSDAYNRFMTIPVALTLSQPVFGTNHTRWNRRIEPVRYEEAKAAYLSATEEVAMKSVSLFFSLLMARENHSIALSNLANAEKLYKVAVEKREMGHISRNDLLQMELNLLDARSALTDSESALSSGMFELRAFLDYGEQDEIVPVLPDSVPDVEVTYAEAYDKAMSRNRFASSIRRRQLEADYAVASARGAMREISLFAQVGFTGTAPDLAGAYRPSGFRDNSVVEVGVSIPLLDWGKRRGKVKVAESNRRLTEARLRQETMEFGQDLYVLVERCRNQRRQVEIGSRAKEIALARYDSNVQTYLIGKISTLDLNDSRVSKDEALRQYIDRLYLYWYYAYQLRSVTLWDFVTDSGIDADFESVVRQ